MAIKKNDEFELIYPSLNLDELTFLQIVDRIEQAVVKKATQPITQGSLNNCRGTWHELAFVMEAHRSILRSTKNLYIVKMGNESSEIDILARDTPGGVKGGTLYTVISVIDRVTTDLAAELGNNMTRVITGGDAPALLPLLAGQYHHEPMLVLQGLAIFATAAPGILPLAALAPGRMPKCGEHRNAQEPPHPGTTENA